MSDITVKEVNDLVYAAEGRIAAAIDVELVKLAESGILIAGGDFRLLMTQRFGGMSYSHSEVRLDPNWKEMT